jgi:hypothetical protein
MPVKIRADKWFYFIIFEVTGIMDIDRYNKEVFLKTIANGLRVNFKHPAVYQLCINFAPRPMTPKEVEFWYRLDLQDARDAEDNSRILLAIRNGFAEYFRLLKHQYLPPKYRGRGFLATMTILRPPPKVNASQTILGKVLAVALSIPRKRRADFQDIEPPAKKFKLSPFSALKESSSHKQMIQPTNGVFRKGTWHGISYEIVDVDYPILPDLRSYLVVNREFQGADGYYDPSRVNAHSRYTKLRKLEQDVKLFCEQIAKYGGYNLQHVIGVKAHDDRMYLSLTRDDWLLGQIQVYGWDEPIGSWGKGEKDRPFLYYADGPYPKLPPAKFPESICTEKLDYRSIVVRRRFKTSPIPDCVSREHGLICGC